MVYKYTMDLLIKKILIIQSVFDSNGEIKLSSLINAIKPLFNSVYVVLL